MKNCHVLSTWETILEPENTVRQSALINLLKAYGYFVPPLVISDVGQAVVPPSPNICMWKCEGLSDAAADFLEGRPECSVVLTEDA